MGNWGQDGFGSSPTTEDLFQRTIDKFPAELKQAMFAAASRGPIVRRNWNGCALNAAGFEVGKQDSVKSMEAAAETFGISYQLVNDFISRWDSLSGTDEECTQFLRTLIEKAGLFKGPRTRKRAKVVVDKVYEGKLREEFDSLLESDMVPDTEIALELLTA